MGKYKRRFLRRSCSIEPMHPKTDPSKVILTSTKVLLGGCEDVAFYFYSKLIVTFIGFGWLLGCHLVVFPWLL